MEDTDMTETARPTPPAVQEGAESDALQATAVYGKLPAQDLERAKDYYQQKLGLIPFAERMGHAYFDVAGVRFILFASQGGASGTHAQLGFVVDVVERGVTNLRAKGVVWEEYPDTHEGIADYGFMKVARFKDSEGNLVSLAENPGISTL